MRMKISNNFSRRSKEYSLRCTREGEGACYQKRKKLGNTTKGHGRKGWVKRTIAGRLDIGKSCGEMVGSRKANVLWGQEITLQRGDGGFFGGFVVFNVE